MATAKHTRARRAHSLALSPRKTRRKPALQPSLPSSDTAVCGDGGAIGAARRRALRDRSPTARSGRFAPGGDVDVALVLRRIVADEIGRQVERIDLLLGVVP